MENVIFSLYDSICSNIQVRQKLATESRSSSVGQGRISDMQQCDTMFVQWLG